MPERLWSEFRAEIRTEELTDLAVAIYQKHFTSDDIQQLIAFYKSPVGQKLLREQPALLQESLEVGKRWGEDVVDRVRKKLREQGYSGARTGDANVATPPRNQRVEPLRAVTSAERVGRVSWRTNTRRPQNRLRCTAVRLRCQAG